MKCLALITCITVALAADQQWTHSIRWSEPVTGNPWSVGVRGGTIVAADATDTEWSVTVEANRKCYVLTVPEGVAHDQVGRPNEAFEIRFGKPMRSLSVPWFGGDVWQPAH